MNLASDRLRGQGTEPASARLTTLPRALHCGDLSVRLSSAIVSIDVPLLALSGWRHRCVQHGACTPSVLAFLRGCYLRLWHSRWTSCPNGFGTLGSAASPSCAVCVGVLRVGAEVSPRPQRCTSFQCYRLNLALLDPGVVVVWVFRGFDCRCVQALAWHPFTPSSASLLEHLAALCLCERLVVE